MCFMEEGFDGLFEGEDVGPEVFGVEDGDAHDVFRRLRMVADISSVHGYLMDVLEDDWGFDSESGGDWWNVGVSYSGDNGSIMVCGSRNGCVQIDYLMNQELKDLPDYVDEAMDSLKYTRNPRVVREFEKSIVGMNMTLEGEADLGDETVQRYIKDVAGFYAGVDRDLHK